MNRQCAYHLECVAVVAILIQTKMRGGNVQDYRCERPVITGLSKVLGEVLLGLGKLVLPSPIR
jgi:hypothetical protein